MQGEMMLGHKAVTISDIYAVPDPANLGRVLAAIDSVIDKILCIAPHVFDPETTGVLVTTSLQKK